MLNYWPQAPLWVQTVCQTLLVFAQNWTVLKNEKNRIRITKYNSVELCFLNSQQIWICEENSCEIYFELLMQLFIQVFRLEHLLSFWSCGGTISISVLHLAGQDIYSYGFTGAFHAGLLIASWVWADKFFNLGFYCKPSLFLIWYRKN